jgi:hypothetical protein
MTPPITAQRADIAVERSERMEPWHAPHASAGSIENRAAPARVAIVQTCAAQTHRQHMVATVSAAKERAAAIDHTAGRDPEPGMLAIDGLAQPPG